MPSQPSRQMFRKKINCHEVIREDTDVGDNLLPKSHLVASLLKRWLLGTYQGAVRPVHLDYYLDEYTFRFNRRTSRSRGKLFLPFTSTGSWGPASNYARNSWEKSRPDCDIRLILATQHMVSAWVKCIPRFYNLLKCHLLSHALWHCNAHCDIAWDISQLKCQSYLSNDKNSIFFKKMLRCWTRKKSKFLVFRHSGHREAESRNPVFSMS